MKNVIIAEDDPGIQDVTKTILEKEGYHVTLFSNGEPIMENRYEIPDIFILDKLLPGIDGLDICRYLKSHEETKDIPVLMLSASPHIGEQAKDAGADGFLEKPFHIRDLVNIVQHIVA